MKFQPLKRIYMKMKFQQSLSELREFASEKDKGFKYLRATFVEEGSSLLFTLGLGNAAQFRINIYPGRDAEGNIDAEQAKSLEDAFNSGALDKEVYYVDRIAVPVAPHYRVYSAGPNKGQLVMDGGVPHLYETVNITCFMRPQPDGTEVCAVDKDTLASRARAIQNFRCKNNEWILKSVYDQAVGNAADAEAEQNTIPDGDVDEVRAQAAQPTAAAEDNTAKAIAEMKAKIAALSKLQGFGYTEYMAKVMYFRVPISPRRNQIANYSNKKIKTSYGA